MSMSTEPVVFAWPEENIILFYRMYLALYVEVIPSYVYKEKVKHVLGKIIELKILTYCN